MSDVGLLMPDFGGGDTFSTYLYASRNHPNKELRERVFDASSKWVDEALPSYTTEQISKTITQEQGTLIEPFRLTPADADLATMLIKMAFSQVYQQTRFRIVSRDTIGSEGGLVITNNLKSYYVERFALGNNRTAPAKAWTFCPANEPSLKVVAKLVRPKVVAKCKFSDNGLMIEIKIPALSIVKWTSKSGGEEHSNPPQRRGNPHSGLVRDMTLNSTIGPKQDLVDDLGLRIDLAGDQIVIAPKSPESVVRFTAHLMKKSVIQIDPGPSYPGRMKLLIGLAPPAEPPVDLEYATVFTEGVLGDWLDVEMDRGPYIENRDRIEILEWLTTKPINQSFKEYQI